MSVNVFFLYLLSLPVQGTKKVKLLQCFQNHPFFWQVYVLKTRKHSISETNQYKRCKNIQLHINYLFGLKLKRKINSMMMSQFSKQVCRKDINHDLSQCVGFLSSSTLVSVWVKLRKVPTPLSLPNSFAIQSGLSAAVSKCTHFQQF